GGGAGHIGRPVYFHTFSDSRCTRRAVAYDRVLLFFAVARGRTALASDLLGISRDVRLECAHERPDRPGFSCRSARALFAAHAEFATRPETASGFEHAGVFRARRALAHSSGAAKSGAGRGARISVVLLHQWTRDALPEQARAAGV